jgi:hypothetical protein
LGSQPAGCRSARRDGLQKPATAAMPVGWSWRSGLRRMRATIED